MTNTNPESMKPYQDPYAAPSYQAGPMTETPSGALAKWVYLTTLGMALAFCFFGGGPVGFFRVYYNMNVGSRWLWALAGLPCAYRMIMVYRVPSKVAAPVQKWLLTALRLIAIMLMFAALFVSAALVLITLWRAALAYLEFHTLDLSQFQIILDANLITGLLVFIGFPGLTIFEFSRLAGYVVRRMSERKTVG
jgi:hypothetical protein